MALCCRQGVRLGWVHPCRAVTRGENLRSVTWVIVEEVKSGDWGIGGNGLTTADVQALRGQAPATVPG